jgi:hypothetical protein
LRLKTRKKLTTLETDGATKMNDENGNIEDESYEMAALADFCHTQTPEVD